MEEIIKIENVCKTYHIGESPVRALDGVSLSIRRNEYVAIMGPSGQRYHNMELWEKMELRGTILILFSRFMREARPKVWSQDERMKKVLAYIHSHISQSIDVEELANVVFITKPYLIRLFKREFGTSPVQYINKKKVERAQLLLFTTDKPVKEIAYTLGFSDHSYFIRLFRKLSGIPPQEYRNCMR